MTSDIKPDFDFKEGYDFRGKQLEAEKQKYDALLSTVKRLQEENEKLNQWKREEIAVWGPILDYFQKEDKLIKLGSSISEEALRRSKSYVRLQEEKKELVEALNSITYKDSWGGVIRIGQHGDSEVPEIVYKALKSSELNK